MKTIAVIPNWTSISRAELEPAYQLTLTRIAEWVASGKYTDQKYENVDFETGTKTIERWEWVNEAAADEYIAFATELLGEMYPDLQITKVAE